jgi:hypothetical protein
VRKLLRLFSTLLAISPLTTILANKGYGDVIHNTGRGSYTAQCQQTESGGYRGTLFSRRESTSSFASPKLQP